MDEIRPDARGLWQPGGGDGVWSLGRAVRGYGFSPDDAHLAWWEGDAGETVVRCVEVASGREVMTVKGRFALAGLAWPSPEVLWVLHWKATGEVRVVAHAVPDAGVLGALALPNVSANRCRVTVAHGGATALVAPMRWNLAGRAAGKVRFGYVLKVDGLERLAALDPDEVKGLARMPVRRQAVAALGPDGARVALAYGGFEGARGRVALVDWRTGDVAWLAAPLRTPAEDVLWVDRATVAVLGRGGERAPEEGPEGEVAVASSRNPEHALVVADDVPEGGGGAAVGPWAALDVSPDRERLLVAGCTRPEPVRGRKSPSRYATGWWLDLATGEVTRTRALGPGADVAAGAVWPPAGEGWFVALWAAKRGVARVGPWRPDAGDARGLSGEPHAVDVTMDGAKPARATLARSPAGRYVVARWEVSEPRGTTRLAVVSARRFVG